MKITKPNADPERYFCIYLITSDRFCKEVLPLASPQYFQTSYAKEVCKWVEEYYGQFSKAPKKDIRSIYHAKRPLITDEETLDLCSTFLASISKEWETLEPNNLDYEIRSAVNYLKLRSLEVLNNSIQDSITENNPTKGEQAISNYKRVEKPFGQGVSLLHDASKVTNAFMDEDVVLFSFPGALGSVAGKFCRGDFISFLAPMKRGKTHYLWYTAETAMHFSFKVVFFTLEMTENQMIKRAWKSLVAQPKTTMEVSIPFFSRDSEDEKWTVETKEEERKGIDCSIIEDLQKKFRRKFRKGDVRIISLPTKSATVSDLVSHLDNMEHYENYIPDVIIVDYADILLAGKGFKGEYRHQLDDIWSALRKLAQEKNCLVVTASQTEKTTFKQDISEGSAAEDVRKIAHITCGLALNQTKVERELGVIRISQVVAREEKTAFQQAVVLQCLDIGRACVDSRLQNEVEILVEETEKKAAYGRKKH